jgi:hypothetical protein
MRGRPSLHTAENAERARKFCMLGATNEDLAMVRGVAPMPSRRAAISPTRP